MPQIWANYLLQATLTSVAPSAGWVNVGDVLQRRGSDVQSTVVDVLPAPDGPADPIQRGQPGGCGHDRPAPDDAHVRRAGELDLDRLTASPRIVLVRGVSARRAADGPEARPRPPW